MTEAHAWQKPSLPLEEIVSPSPEGSGANTQEGAQSQLKLLRLGHASERPCERLSGGPSFSPKNLIVAFEPTEHYFVAQMGRK